MKNLQLLVAFTIINFISWNYLGILFILNIMILFYFLEYLKDKTWRNICLLGYLLFLLFNISAVFWLYKVDEKDGIYALIFNASTMFAVFCLAVYLSKKQNIINTYLYLVGFLWNGYIQFGT